jgi:hypothetical protein
MALEHQHISVGDRIYIAKVDQLGTVRFKDARGIVVDPFLTPRIPLRVHHQDGKYDGLKDWRDFVTSERTFENCH